MDEGGIPIDGVVVEVVRATPGMSLYAAARHFSLSYYRG